MPQTKWTAALAQRFAQGFRPGRPDWRTVGRESEYPLVRPDGTAGEIGELWPILQRLDPTLRPKRDPGGLMVELAGDRMQIVAEVGKGTIEIVLGPFEDLIQIAEAHTRALDLVREAAAQAGQLVLGYGIQPVTPPSAGLMTKKQRYGVLHEVIGEDWLSFALTASDQVHAAIGRDEITEQTNVGHLLTPALIALCANSPIADGRDQGVCSLREARMGVIGAAQGRHGMPISMDRDLDHMLRRYIEQPWLIRYEGDLAVACSGTFADHLEGRGPDSDAQLEAGWQDFLTHEHYIWNSARPRSNHGTIEMRAACQQPHNETMAAATFAVATACAADELHKMLVRRFGDELWTTMREWHHSAIRTGMGEPEHGLIDEILDIQTRALVKRGRREEMLLVPLYGRLESGQNPAQVAQEVFAEGGLPALLQFTAG